MEFYKRHICRLDPWPDCVNRTFEKLEVPVYMQMWGPCEFRATGIPQGLRQRRTLEGDPRAGPFHLRTLRRGNSLYDAILPEQAPRLGNRHLRGCLPFAPHRKGRAVRGNGAGFLAPCGRQIEAGKVALSRKDLMGCAPLSPPFYGSITKRPPTRGWTTGSSGVFSWFQGVPKGREKLLRKVSDMVS